MGLVCGCKQRGIVALAWSLLACGGSTGIFVRSAAVWPLHAAALAPHGRAASCRGRAVELLEAVSAFCVLALSK